MIETEKETTYLTGNLSIAKMMGLNPIQGYCELSDKKYYYYNNYESS